MDSIRLSQINEALNYDKNINAMVFNLEKKRTAMFPDAEVLPYSQIGEETMTTTKEGANSLKVLLDAKLATVAQLNRSVGIDAGYASAADDIGQVQPVVQAYNQVVAPFISTQLTQQTKDAILTELRYLLDRLGALEKGLRGVLNDNRITGNTMVSCIVARTVFHLMSKQIKVGKLLVIREEDINQKVLELLQRPLYKRRLGNATFPRPPGGGPGPGPGPGPGGPGGFPRGRRGSPPPPPGPSGDTDGDTEGDPGGPPPSGPPPSGGPPLGTDVVRPYTGPSSAPAAAPVAALPKSFRITSDPEDSGYDSVASASTFRGFQMDRFSRQVDESESDRFADPFDATPSRSSVSPATEDPQPAIQLSAKDEKKVEQLSGLLDIYTHLTQRSGRGMPAMTPALVNYAPGVRQSKRGGGKTIQAMAPILEFNETADDPYLMRQQVH